MRSRSAASEGNVSEIEMIVPSLMVSVCEFSGWLETPSMRLPQNILNCRFNDPSLSSALLAKAMVIVNARQANELRVFKAIREIAEC